MAANTYFLHPFASSGDTTPIPVETQPDGSVSYTEGYGPDYELDLLTDPDALPIGRTTMNQLFLDITTQQQQYSQYGTPAFITTLQNGGVPFEYPIFARTYYLGNVYENQVADNTATPGTDSSWLLISGDATGILAGTVLDFAGFTAPAGYLSCDGSAVLRSSYPVLLAAITQTQTGTTTNTLNTVTGLTSTVQMYVGMPLECANFASGTTVASITSSTSITASNTASASGAVSIQFFNWGNGDGTTTFNVPMIVRKTTIGQGGSGGTSPGVTGTKVGQSGGEEAHTMQEAELASHSHGLTNSATGIYGTIGSAASTLGIGTAAFVACGIANTGSSTPFNVMQPSVIMYKIIKT